MMDAMKLLSVTILGAIAGAAAAGMGMALWRIAPMLDAWITKHGIPDWLIISSALAFLGAQWAFFWNLPDSRRERK